MDGGAEPLLVIGHSGDGEPTVNPILLRSVSVLPEEGDAYAELELTPLRANRERVGCSPLTFRWIQ